MGKKVKILRQTMEAARAGSYTVGDRNIPLPYDLEKISQVKFYTQQQIRKLAGREIPEDFRWERPHVILRNQDTLEAAFELDRMRRPGEKPVLVLNFANPHRPGGGIRAIPRTQEEHLCVKTTLLTSLESREAWPFYQTNLDCGTEAQTDAVLFSPNTLVIRNPDLTLREDPFPVGVMTVSAPIASRMDFLELPELEEILEERIRGMLAAAAEEGYRKVVLGAWGCGNFGNDPAVVAGLFHKVLREPVCAGLETVVMAVLDTSETQVCYSCFGIYFPEEGNG